MRAPLYTTFAFMLVLVFSVLVYASSNYPEGGMSDEYKEYMERYGASSEGMVVPEGFNPEDMKNGAPEGFDPNAMKNGMPPEGFNYSYGSSYGSGYSTSSYESSYYSSTDANSKWEEKFPDKEFPFSKDEYTNMIEYYKPKEINVKEGVFVEGPTVSSISDFPDDYDKYATIMVGHSSGGAPVSKEEWEKHKDEWKTMHENIKEATNGGYYNGGAAVLPTMENPSVSSATTLSDEEIKKFKEEFMSRYNAGEDKERLMQEWREKVEPFMHATMPSEPTMIVDPNKYQDYEKRFDKTVDIVCSATAGSEGKACERLQEISGDPCSGKSNEELATCVRAKEEIAECVSTGVSMEECAKEFSSSPEYMKYEKYQCQSEECARRYHSVSTELVVIMDMDGEVQTCRNDVQCMEDAKKKFCGHMNNKWQEFKKLSEEEKKKMMEKMKEEGVKFMEEIKKNAEEVEKKLEEHQKTVYNNLESTMFEKYEEYIAKKERERDELKAQGKDTSELDFIITQMKDELDAARKAMAENRYKDSIKPLHTINDELHKKFDEGMKFIEDKTDYELPVEVC